MSLIELAERVEKASGPDRELDGLIAAALNGGRHDRDGYWWKPGVRGFCIAERFSGSLDAAMTLAGSEAVSVLLTAIDECQEDAVSDWVKALPRHVCAAALRARAQQEQTK